jgi:hypothetical protein
LLQLQTIIKGVIILCFLASCKKDVVEVIPDNDAPYYSKISSVKVRNYVNRLFIDLLGREPLDSEMNAETAALQETNVSTQARETLINKLMTDSIFRDGDTSYTLAYHKRIYELGKIRFLEGVSEALLIDQAIINKSDAYSDSLAGNIPGYEEKMQAYNKIVTVLNSREAYQKGYITIMQMSSYMCNNDFYDIINMNSFNFVNACFDDLYFRFPTQSEFQIGYNMVEDNVPGALFGVTGQTKADFIQILTNNNECVQGIIIWSYKTLLARDPTSLEMSKELLNFGVNKDLKALQKRILVTNEYANF